MLENGAHVKIIEVGRSTGQNLLRKTPTGRFSLTASSALTSGSKKWKTMLKASSTWCRPYLWIQCGTAHPRGGTQRSLCGSPQFCQGDSQGGNRYRRYENRSHSIFSSSHRFYRSGDCIITYSFCGIDFSVCQDNHTSYLIRGFFSCIRHQLHLELFPQQLQNLAELLDLLELWLKLQRRNPKKPQSLSKRIQLLFLVQDEHAH